MSIYTTIREHMWKNFIQNNWKCWNNLSISMNRFGMSSWGLLAILLMKKKIPSTLLATVAIFTTYFVHNKYVRYMLESGFDTSEFFFILEVNRRGGHQLWHQSPAYHKQKLFQILSNLCPGCWFGVTWGFWLLYGCLNECQDPRARTRGLRCRVPWRKCS